MEKLKGNVHSTTGNEDPEGEYEVELYSFFETRRYIGLGGSTPLPCRFTHGKKSRYPSHIRLRGSQIRSRRVREFSSPPVIDPGMSSP